MGRGKSWGSLTSEEPRFPHTDPLCPSQDHVIEEPKPQAGGPRFDILRPPDVPSARRRVPGGMVVRKGESDAVVAKNSR